MPELRSRPRRLTAGTRNISLALGLCLCAGQLVGTGPAAATPAASTAVAGTTAVAAVAATKPRITILASRRTIGWGSTVTVSARVLDARTGRAVPSGYARLQALRKGKWTTWQNRRVAAGRVVFATAAPRTTVRLRVVYLGAGAYRATVSTGLLVRVTASNAKVLAMAKRLKGSPYRFGASGPRAFDCSGFTQYVYRATAGRKLPHKAHLQQRYGRAVSRANARPGDLVIVRSGSYGYHAGVYAGKGYIYDSPRAGQRVGKHKLWTRSYVVRRLVG